MICFCFRQNKRKIELGGDIILKMGCCCSSDIPNFDGRLTTINVADEKSSDSVQVPVKNSSGGKGGDIVPLLEGPEPLNFADLKFSSDSSSIEIDMERIEQLLKQESNEDKKENASDKESDDGIFKENHTLESDDE